jgi:hypothetical protein
MLSAMDDLGAPSSYLALAEGVPVYSSDGRELGKVQHVLAEPGEDIFDGFVIDTSVLPGGHRFDAEAAESLPEPSANPGVLEVDADDMVAEHHAKLRRAWDRISGNY